MKELQELEQHVHLLWGKLPVPPANCLVVGWGHEEAQVAQCLNSLSYDAVDMDGLIPSVDSVLYMLTDSAAAYYIASYLLYMLAKVSAPLPKNIPSDFALLHLSEFLKSRSDMERIHAYYQNESPACIEVVECCRKYAWNRLEAAGLGRYELFSSRK